MKILLSVVFTLVALFVAGLIIMFSGIYNVSALNSEPGITKWVLETTSDNSVEHYSKDITVPNLDDPSMIKMGLSHYKEMCEKCHGGPGIEKTELAKGLNPPAPSFAKGTDLDPKEIFWITKNGIKMTGMPAWGKTHSKYKIWAITAAVIKLNDIPINVYNSIPIEEDATADSTEKTDTKVNDLRYH